jgi:K+-transporting ATPase ATPase C chain
MASALKKDILTTVIGIVAFTLFLGIAYPLVVTGIAQIALPHQANGSLVTRDGRQVGSELVGQDFARPEYFHPRPSAAGAGGYDGAASSGSNLGPTSQALADRVATDVQRIREENNLPADAPVPVDAVTASGSGQDPHISPAYAMLQAARVARARGAAEEEVRALVKEMTAPSFLGIAGEPRLNVLLINLRLDERWPLALQSSS